MEKMFVNADKKIFDNFDFSKIAETFKGKIKEQNEKMEHVNIIITGKTGVGKSTLINYLFRENLAETGSGRPVTQSTRCLEKASFPLRIYDTKGLELGKDTQVDIKEDINQIIIDNLKSNQPDSFIHAVWYCINTTSDRVEEEEIDWINQIAENSNNNSVPVVLILTKSFSRKKGLSLRES